MKERDIKQIEISNQVFHESRMSEMNTETQTERIMFPCTTEFKNELGELASTQNKSISELIKSACIAQYGMKSVLPNNVRGRSTKYSSAQEREQAQKAQRTERNSLIKQALNEYRKNHS